MGMNSFKKEHSVVVAAILYNGYTGQRKTYKGSTALQGLNPLRLEIVECVYGLHIALSPRNVTPAMYDCCTIRQKYDVALT